MSNLNISLEDLLRRAPIHADVIIFGAIKKFLGVSEHAISDPKVASSEEVTLQSTTISLTSARPKNRANITTPGGTPKEDDDTYKECVCEIIFELVKLVNPIGEVYQLVQLMLSLAHASTPGSKYHVDLGHGTGFWDGIAGVLTGVMAERWTVVNFPAQSTPEILKGDINLNAFLAHFWSGLEQESRVEEANNTLFAQSAKLHWIVCLENSLGCFPSAANSASSPTTAPTGDALEHGLVAIHGWISHAPELIHRACQDNTSAADSFGRVSLWDRGLSPEGWKFWTGRLKEVSQDGGASETSRTLAEHCWRAMEKISAQGLDG
ncbi:hypothetical protein BJ875DRAFT_488509 [Amylocarpus encephaloides]|uniref:Uncharacterized protein n=1 Tax=Amylocarpus encephaloides TaxID=45428 RepID=A0A9P8C1H0_9HELO|nr:hypothetical protein BJ875DRAFT_488509 [Amylocarpus encephaloides]